MELFLQFVLRISDGSLGEIFLKPLILARSGTWNVNKEATALTFAKASRYLINFVISASTHTG